MTEDESRPPSPNAHERNVTRWVVSGTGSTESATRSDGAPSRAHRSPSLGSAGFVPLERNGTRLVSVPSIHTEARSRATSRPSSRTSAARRPEAAVMMGSIPGWTALASRLALTSPDLDAPLRETSGRGPEADSTDQIPVTTGPRTPATDPEPVASSKPPVATGPEPDRTHPEPVSTGPRSVATSHSVVSPTRSDSAATRPRRVTDSPRRPLRIT